MTSKLTHNNPVIIDYTDGEAFLVRKGDDSGDVFSIDTNAGTPVVAISGNITVTGLVDGRDIAADGATVDSLDAGGVSALTSGEIDQLENIDSVTISNTQWGYLGATDQGLSTTDAVTFNSVIIDSTGAEAFLVRKDSDGGDIFTVDTTNNIVTVNSSRLEVSGAISGTPSTTGQYISVSTSTFTDSDTAGSGTATVSVFNSIAAPTLAATNSSVTTTDAASFYIAGAPIAGTNQTITNPYSLWVDAGTAKFDGDVLFGGESQFRANFNGTDPFIYFDTDDYLVYLRSSNLYRFFVGGNNIFQISANDLTANGNFILDDTNTEALLVRKNSDGGDVFWVDTTNERTHFGDSNFYATFDGTDSFIHFATSNDYLRYNRTDNTFHFTIASIDRLTVDNSTIISEVQHIVDTTNTEAFLVRKDGDSGDVFTVDTTGNAVTVTSSSFDVSGAISGTPSTTGQYLALSASTFTDDATAGSGTATVAVFNSIAAPTLAATNTSVTTTDAATFYISGAPEAGTNQTITNAYALWVDEGNARFDGDLTVSGSLTAGSVTYETIIVDSTNAESLLVRKDSDGGDVFIVDTTNDEVETGTSTTVKITNTTAATSGSTGALQVSGGIAANAASYIDANLDVTGNVTVTGDLTVNGTTTTVDTETLVITDNFGEFNAGPTGSADAGVLFKRYQTISDAGTDGDVTGDPAEESDTAQAGGSATTIVLASGANATDDYYNGWWIKITGGTANNNIRRIKDYVGSTKTATIYSTADETATEQTPPTGADFTASPDATSTYELYDCSYSTMYFDESANEFVFGCVPEDPNGSISPDRYASLHVKSITSEDPMTINGFTSNGVVIVDHTDTEALLVRKDGDAGDVFTVDTSGDIMTMFGETKLQDGTGFSILSGADIGATTLTNDTQKFTRIGMPHYHNAEEPVSLITGDSDGTDNIVAIGGGTTLGNQATIIEFHAAANDATTGSGNVIVRIDNNGLIIDNTNTEALLVRKDGDGGDIFSVDTTNSVVHISNGTGLSINTSNHTDNALRIGYNSSSQQILFERNGGSATSDILVDSGNSLCIRNQDGTNPFIDFILSDSATNDGRVRIFDGRLQTGANNHNIVPGHGVLIDSLGNTFTDYITSASGTATVVSFNSFEAPTLAASNASVTTTNAATVYIQAAPIAGTNQTITNAYALWVDAGNSRFDGQGLFDVTSTEALLIRKESDGGDVLTVDTSGEIITANSQVIIDDTNTEALLVRKDSDSGDVFWVDTTNERTHFGDANFYSTFDGTDSFIHFATSNDYLRYNRTDNTFHFTIASIDRFTVDNTFITSEVPHIVDTTSTEAFLVRKDSDGGDVFTVNTTSNVVTVTSSSFDVSGAISGTPSTTGQYLAISASTFTDNATAGSGTATAAVFNSIAAPTLAATNTSVTTTDAATLYIGGAPVAGTNQTITNAYALWVDSGNVQFDGDLTVSGSLVAASVTYDSLIVDGTSTEALLVRKDGDGGDVLAVDTTNTRVLIGPGDSPSNTSKLSLYGTTASASAGPHLTATTTEDIYPTFQSLNLAHDNIALSFDSYYDGAWKSSDVGSNFAIRKTSDTLSFQQDTGVAQGGAITWNDIMVLQANRVDVEGQLIVDHTNNNAFLVRKNSSGGDIFTVDTTDSHVTVTSSYFDVSGAISGTPSTTGQYISLAASTFTDNVTAGSGTATAAVFNSIAAPTLAATNSAVTTTDAATFYIGGAPTAGANQTITNALSLWVDSGISRFDSQIQIVNPISSIGNSDITQGHLMIGSTTSGIGIDQNEIYRKGTGSFVIGTIDASTSLSLRTDATARMNITDSLIANEVDTVIDVTSTEAFLVRQNSDGGDVFTVNTSGLSVIADATLTVDHTNTEALLVRKDGDGGDIFTVDTTNSIVTVTSSKLEVSGAKSGTPSTTGQYFSASASTFTDSATAGSGTATTAVFNSIAAPTLAATNSSVTTTNAATMYIGGAPIAGTNQTITNSYALWVDSGNAKFDGDLTVDGTLNVGSAEYESLTVDGTSTEALLIRKDSDGGDVFIVDTTNERVNIMDSNYYLTIGIGGTQPQINFDTDDYFTFIRGDNDLRLYLGASNLYSWTPSSFTSNNKVIIDHTDTEALLVRKDGDGGDIFTVNTTSNTVTVTSSSFNVSGAISGTPSTTGQYLALSASTFTDDNTAGSGTATAAVFNSIAAPTLSASNSSVTTTDAASFYIAGAPIAGTNQTITNSYSLWVDAGTARFDGEVFTTNTFTSQNGSGMAAVFGADVGALTLTDATRKFARVGFPHYTNAEEDIIAFVGDSDGTDNILSIGGGTTAANTCTKLRFMSAANTTTTNGSEVAFVDINGLTIDRTTNEAFLVRKVSDGGDVFTVNTTNSTVSINGIDITPSKGQIPETSFSAANNQSSAANVTGFTFAEADVRSFRAIVSVTIVATASLYEQFEIRGLQKATGTWVLSVNSIGDISNVDFSITSSGGNGQIQYTSGNESGFTSSKFKIICTETTGIS